MLLSDKIKKFSVEQAIDYRNRNPVKNLPKLLDWADTFCAGKFEGQRRAISLEGDETTTDSRRSEKEVKRAQRTQKHRLQSGDGAFSSLPLEGTARAHSPAQGKASSALPVLRRVTAKRKNVHGRILPCTFFRFAVTRRSTGSADDAFPCAGLCALAVPSRGRLEKAPSPDWRRCFCVLCARFTSFSLRRLSVVVSSPSSEMARRWPSNFPAQNVSAQSRSFGRFLTGLRLR